MVDRFPIVRLCVEDFPAVFHHDLPQHESLKHRNKRASLPAFQVVRDVLPIFRISSPRAISSANADANDVRFYTFRRVESAHGQQSHDCVALTLGRVAKQEEQQEV